MPRKHKVWRGNMMATQEQIASRPDARPFKIVEVTMCSTLRDFMDATGLSRDFIGETGNEAQIEAALKHPGALLWKPEFQTDQPYELVDPRDYHWKWKDKRDPDWRTKERGA